MIFRDNISRGTALGKEAKGDIDRGELVPDSITIPMILDRIKAKDCVKGCALDGFPRNLTQAEELAKALVREGIALDIVILPRNHLGPSDRQEPDHRAKTAANNNNHPNNIYIDAIKPNGDKCRGCGESTTRSDDQDGQAIDQRHSIPRWLDPKTGTMAAI